MGQHVGLFCVGLGLRHTLCVLHVQFSLAYVAEGVFLHPTARGACGLLLSGLVIAVRALRRDEVPLLAFPHLHGHQLRLPQVAIGLVGHVAFCFVPAHYL